MYPRRSVSRRGLIAGVAATAITSSSVIAQSSGATPEAPDARRVGSPDWGFHLHQLLNPYPDSLQLPVDLPLSTKAVAIEIEIVNDSEQALDFTPIDIRLRDAGGVEYRGGAAIGSEPMINPRNLNPGERSRGWVWFVVPESVVLAEVVYIAPQPQFRVTL